MKNLISWIFKKPYYYIVVSILALVLLPEFLLNYQGGVGYFVFGQVVGLFLSAFLLMIPFYYILKFIRRIRIVN